MAKKQNWKMEITKMRIKLKVVSAKSGTNNNNKHNVI